MFRERSTRKTRKAGASRAFAVAVTQVAPGADGSPFEVGAPPPPSDPAPPGVWLEGPPDAPVGSPPPPRGPPVVGSAGDDAPQPAIAIAIARAAADEAAGRGRRFGVAGEAGMPGA